jgi:UDP-N-acetyl-D-glucosamine dehydrogenase
VVHDVDVVLIVTDHDAIDFALVAAAAKRVVDTRNVLSEAQVQGVYRRA